MSPFLAAGHVSDRFLVKGVANSHDPSDNLAWRVGAERARADLLPEMEFPHYRRSIPMRVQQPELIGKTQRRGPKLLHVSEEIKRLAELLEAEILAWPNVTSRPMFGLNALYRGPNIFAVLPRTRAMDVPDTIAFRLSKRPRHIMDELRNDDRIISSTAEAKWISFVMTSDSEIHAALKWLALAYRQAVNRK